MHIHIMIKRFSKNGLPLKITAEWTNDDYYNKSSYDSDDLICTNVQGWLVRINGVKFPRPQMIDGKLDYSYRWTLNNNEESKLVAVEKALREYEQN